MPLSLVTLLPTAVLIDYRPPRGAPVPRLLMLVRDDAGHVTARRFPDEIDACPEAVVALDTPTVRVERDRLYFDVANGTAV